MKLFGTIDEVIDHLDRPMFFGNPFTRTAYHIFPVLGRGPNSTEFIEDTPFDPTIRTEFESGAVKTRARFTSVPKRWTIVLDHLSDADKIILDNFQRNEVHFGADDFKWDNGQDQVTYRVRFLKPIIFAIKPRDPRLFPNEWRAEFELVSM